MFDKFTQGAKMAMCHARQRAISLEAASIGVAHMALGLIDEDRKEHGVLARLGVDVAALESALVRVALAEHERAPHKGASLPFTECSKAVLESAMEHSLVSNHVGLEHFLHALVGYEESDSSMSSAQVGHEGPQTTHACFVTAGLSVDLLGVRQDVIREFSKEYYEAEAGDPERETAKQESALLVACRTMVGAARSAVLLGASQVKSYLQFLLAIIADPQRRDAVRRRCHQVGHIYLTYRRVAPFAVALMVGGYLFLVGRPGGTAVMFAMLTWVISYVALRVAPLLVFYVLPILFVLALGRAIIPEHSSETVPVPESFVMTEADMGRASASGLQAIDATVKAGPNEGPKAAEAQTNATGEASAADAVPQSPLMAIAQAVENGEGFPLGMIFQFMHTAAQQSASEKISDFFTKDTRELTPVDDPQEIQRLFSWIENEKSLAAEIDAAARLASQVNNLEFLSEHHGALHRFGILRRRSREDGAPYYSNLGVELGKSPRVGAIVRKHVRATGDNASLKAFVFLRDEGPPSTDLEREEVSAAELEEMILLETLKRSHVHRYMARIDEWKKKLQFHKSTIAAAQAVKAAVNAELGLDTLVKERREAKERKARLAAMAQDRRQKLRAANKKKRQSAAASERKVRQAFDMVKHLLERVSGKR